MIRVLLVDDHPVVRAGYQRLLEQAGDIAVVAQAARTDEAYAAFAAHAPDVTVTDLAMPGSGGLDLIGRVLARAPRARILVFSMYDSAMLVQRAFELGARGFLAKSSAPEELLEGVRRVAAGQRYLDPGLPVRWLDAPSPDDRLATLTPREFEIFRLLASGATPAACAQALKLSAKTISNHQTTIKDKLGVSTTAAMVHLALRHGVL
ncbi:MAG: response regulator transcription factor [Burkholderiaceae bacterium]